MALGTTGALILGGATLGAGYLSSQAAEGAAETASAATREAALRAEALNRERYAQAVQGLMPYMQRSEIASRQLMAELGLPQAPNMQQYAKPSLITAGTPSFKPLAAKSIGRPRITSGTPYMAKGLLSSFKPVASMVKPIFGSQKPLAAEAVSSLFPGQSSGQAYASPYLGSSPSLATNIPPGMEFTPRGDYTPSGLDDPYMARPDYAEIMPGEEFTGRQMPVSSQSFDYRSLPGYQDLMDEQLAAVEQTAASAGGTAYGGRRLKEAARVGGALQRSFYENEMARREREAAREQAAYENYMGRGAARDVNLARMQQADYANYMNRQQSYYNNYMNMLQNLASPSTATNVASMGMGQAANIGQQNLAATAQANQAMMQGAAAQNAAIADAMGGVSNIASAYMMSPQAGAATTALPATGGMSGYLV